MIIVTGIYLKPSDHLNCKSVSVSLSGAGVGDRVHSGDDGSAGGERRERRRGQVTCSVLCWSHFMFTAH